MESDHLWSLIAVGLVSLIAAISPGPDFFIVMRNSLRYSRKIGMFTALGVTTALIIHLFYTILGIAVLIMENVVIYNMIKYLGAAYLLYLGISALVSSFNKEAPLKKGEISYEPSISTGEAYRQGFLTNLLNPKAAFFFISLFSQFISADTTMTLKIEYALVNLTVALGWFLLLVFMITGKSLTQWLERFRTVIDRATGVALIILSSKIIFT